MCYFATSKYIRMRLVAGGRAPPGPAWKADGVPRLRNWIMPMKTKQEMMKKEKEKDRCRAPQGGSA